MYNFAEVSGHILESSQTWGFGIPRLHYKPVSNHFFSREGGGGGENPLIEMTVKARRKTLRNVVLITSKNSASGKNSLSECNACWSWNGGYWCGCGCVREPAQRFSVRVLVQFILKSTVIWLPINTPPGSRERIKPTRQLTPPTRQLTPLEEGSYAECSTLLSTGHLAESCGTTGSTLYPADQLFGGKQTNW